MRVCDRQKEGAKSRLIRAPNDVIVYSIFTCYIQSRTHSLPRKEVLTPKMKEILLLMDPTKKKISGDKKNLMKNECLKRKSIYISHLAQSITNDCLFTIDD